MQFNICKYFYCLKCKKINFLKKYIYLSKIIQYKRYFQDNKLKGTLPTELGLLTDSIYMYFIFKFL